MLFTQNLRGYVFNNFPTESNITMVFVRKLSGMRWVYYYLFHKKFLQIKFTVVFVPKLSRLWCVISMLFTYKKLPCVFFDHFLLLFPKSRLLPCYLHMSSRGIFSTTSSTRIKLIMVFVRKLSGIAVNI